MSGKYIKELRLEELRMACKTQGISITGSKPDLEIRLTEHIRTTGVDPARVRITPVMHSPPRDGNSENSRPPQPNTTGQTTDLNVSQSPTGIGEEHNLLNTTFGSIDAEKLKNDNMYF